MVSGYVLVPVVPQVAPRPRGHVARAIDPAGPPQHGHPPGEREGHHEHFPVDRPGDEPEAQGRCEARTQPCAGPRGHGARRGPGLAQERKARKAKGSALKGHAARAEPEHLQVALLRRGEPRGTPGLPEVRPAPEARQWVRGQIVRTPWAGVSNGPASSAGGQARQDSGEAQRRCQVAHAQRHGSCAGPSCAEEGGTRPRVSAGLPRAATALVCARREKALRDHPADQTKTGQRLSHELLADATMAPPCPAV
eukprot:CAMPEP_0206004398 /NCGR_PEP_ID=MMETSP1464-20131121/3953_1 /ASSEMBLY_ACC=CAM_ASM_001124 /TAXON_ID=119497 /ORGANISM="Exanthemachrysis gayraliae, Strain RCC1523" /LENGTH=251 /DNA_ID=CAMNT_0053377803 /DNA_START=209 /DNA_END=961 /DNA_ORIENTATION=-